MADLSGQVATGALTPAAAAQQMLQQHLQG